MVAIVLPSRWQEQPQYPVAIDNANGVSRDIAVAAIASPYMYDAVTGRPPASSTGVLGYGAIPFGVARTYNNSSDFFATPSSADNPSAYTIVIHFRPRGFTSTWGFNGIGAKTSNLGTTNGYGTFVSTSTLRVAHGGSSTYFALSGTTAALSANPSHPLCVVLAWTGAEIRAHVDGVLKDSGAFTQSIASGNGYFKVMSNRDTSSGEGDVLSSYLFTRALTDDEAVSLSLAPYQIFKPRTARIYSFPSGAGNNYTLTGAVTHTLTPAANFSINRQHSIAGAVSFTLTPSATLAINRAYTLTGAVTHTLTPSASMTYTAAGTAAITGAVTYTLTPSAAFAINRAYTLTGSVSHTLAVAASMQYTAQQAIEFVGAVTYTMTPAAVMVGPAVEAETASLAGLRVHAAREMPFFFSKRSTRRRTSRASWPTLRAA